MKTKRAEALGDALPPTHCEWCGAEYDRRPEPHPTARRVTPPPPAETATTEPATRCEWCGAEYALPEDSGG